jgi:hypothetical protein
MDPVTNPYNPGAGTKPPALVGRDGLLASFNVTLQRAKLGRPGKSMMPTGLRGVGKTVLLNRFADQGRELDYKVAFVEAPETGNLAVLLASQLRTVLLELDRLGAVSAAVRRGLRVLKSFSITPRADGMPKFEVGFDPERGVADSGDLASDVSDLIVAVGEAARDRGRGLLIAIDEVQYLSESELAAIISAIHRTTQLALPVVLVGAGLPQITALAGEAKSYAERLFTYPVVDSLSDAEAREAIQKPARDAGVVFEAEALGEIVRLTHGYPYFIQEWAYHVWNSAPDSPIRARDVRDAEAYVFAELDANFFRVRYDRLTPTERKYLRAMATMGAGAHRSGEIAERYGAKVASVAPMRSALIRKGMIYSPQHGDTALPCRFSTSSCYA